MINLFFKILRGPSTVYHLAIDRCFIPFWLKAIGVKFGQDCRFDGMPFISMYPEAVIQLGDRVHVNSKLHNPLGLTQLTMLTVLSPGSFIRIGNPTSLGSASIIAQSPVTFGDEVLIGAGACIWDTDFHPLSTDQRRYT
jgi:acetyltransferase-like isoleucine patch superfamily enzyme